MKSSFSKSLKIPLFLLDTLKSFTDFKAFLIAGRTELYETLKSSDTKLKIFFKEFMSLGLS